MKYRIGVDGGGTKTAIALFDQQGEMISIEYTRGSNHEDLPGAYEEAAAIIKEGIYLLLEKEGLNILDVDSMIMGLAGADHPFQIEELKKVLTLENEKIPVIFNDGYLAVLAGTTGGIGISLNAGTGTCCGAIDENGNMSQLAGLGGLTGDIGNGMWVSENAFRLMYDQLFLNKEATCLTEWYREERGFASKEEFMAGAMEDYYGEYRDEFIRYLIGLFFKAVDIWDGPAMKVLNTMVERAADLITAQIVNLEFADEVEVVLTGSVHTKVKNQIYLDALKNTIEERTHCKVTFYILEEPPVSGCGKWNFN